MASELGKKRPQIFDSDAAMAKQLRKLMEENDRLKNELSESQEEVLLWIKSLSVLVSHQLPNGIQQVEKLKQKIEFGHEHKKMKSDDDSKSQSR